MKRIAFDVNALAFLCEANVLSEPDYLARAARRKLRYLVRHHQAKVIVGHGLIGELCGLYKADRRKYFKELREVEFLCAGRILAVSHDLIACEVRHRRRLTDWEAFLSRTETCDIFRKARIDKWILERDAKARAGKDKYGVLMTGARTDPDAKGAELELTKAFKGDRDATIDQCCRSIMRAKYEDYGLTKEEARWESPELAPAFRADVAYHIARDFIVTFEKKGNKPNIDSSDLYDNAAFADAVYADVLVTNDKAFRAIAAEAGTRTGVRLMKCVDWANALLRP